MTPSSVISTAICAVGNCCLCGQRTANQESGSQSYNRIKFGEYGKNQRVAEYVVSLADSGDTVGANPVSYTHLDLLLASATVPAIYLFFKNYIAQNLHKETKLSARLMNWFLILMCIVIGVFLSITLFQEVGK